MGSKRTPPPPDYTGAALAQAQASKENLNIQNFANRPTINTPFGSESWQTSATTDPATGQRVTQWTQNTTLAPQLQQALDSQINIQQGRSDLANAFMGRVGEEYKQPFDFQNLPALTSGGTPGQMQTNVADYSRGLQTDVNPNRAVGGFNFSGPQMGVNFGNAPALPQYDAGFRNQVANDLMSQMLPVQRMQQQALETDLSNRGFKQGTEAYKRALDDLNARQAGERFNALNMAGNEAQRLFGMQMGSRQQGVNETLSAGNFANQAQGQLFGQLMGQANLANQAGAQEFGQNLSAAQFNNQALGQAANLDLARMQAMNQAQQQQFNLNQQYADAQNRLRQQAIAEQQLRRGMSLNEMNALLSGQQVGMPQMPSFQRAGVAETPQLLQAAQMGYQAQLDAANARNAGIGNTMGGLFSLGSAAISNPFMFSDRRLKRNVKRVGTHAIGVGIYDYDMAGYRQRGVIAQEVAAVRPDLVRRHASGYLTVNYGAL